MIHTKRRKLSIFEIKSIMQRQKYKCCLCKHLLPASCEIDHKVPLWAHGHDVSSNMQALCGTCHNTKTRKEDIIRKMYKKQRHTRILYVEDEHDEIICLSPFFQIPMTVKLLLDLKK